MANRSLITGRLTADPELRQTPGGKAVTSFTVAVQKKYQREGADFIDCVAWEKKAEFLCRYFAKGKWVEVDGRLQTRIYEDKENNKRKAVELVADEVNFVGDKARGDEDGAEPAPPPPPDFDPFAKPPSASANGDGSDFAEYDDDGDLPF